MLQSSDAQKFFILKQNLSWNFLGQLIAKISLLFFHIIFANLIGATGYGEFSFIYVGGMIILQPALDLGLNQLITKWISRGNIEVIRLSFNIKGLISITLIPLALFLGWLMQLNIVLQITIIGFFFINSLQHSIFGILRGLEDLRPESLTICFQNLLACFLLGIFVFYEIRATWVGSLILMLTRIFGTFFILGILWKKYLKDLKKRKKSPKFLKQKNLLKEAITLGLVLFIIQFYFRIDTIMLGILSSEIEVGFYSVAYNLMEGSFFIPIVVMSSIFPGLSISKSFLFYFKKGAFILTISGIVIGITFFAFGNFFISYFFSPEFQNSVEILKILALAIPIVFWGYLTTQSLVALDKNKIYLIIIICGLILNLILNFLLIPKYGAIGAAIATVITEAFIPLGCLLILSKFLSSRNNINDSKNS